MSKNLIYCYSGSGNCLDIARNIAKKLGDTDIVMMRTAPAITDAREAERVGFVFPCYAGGLPGKVEEYVRNVAVGRSAYKFAVCSYAGYPGVGLSVIDSIVGLDYWAGISHQCACIWLLPHKLMLPPMGPDKAQARADPGQAQGPEAQCDRGLHRLRTVRKALPQREYPSGGRKARLRHRLHPVSQLPAILPQAGHQYGRPHREPGALP